MSHPEMWEIPMTTLLDVRGGRCSMADGCFYTEEADAIQKIFTQNFLNHYTKTKAPFPLFFHAAWFYNRPHRVKGFLNFIDSILALPDVYFVTRLDHYRNNILLAVSVQHYRFALRANH